MSANTRFVIKQGDRREPIERTLRGSDGVAVNLTGATVKFLMRPEGGGAVKIDAAATVVDAPTGAVRYSWDSDDTDTAGKFEAEFEVTFGDGTKETFPNEEYIPVLIIDDIG